MSIGINKIQLIRSICKDSFFDFVKIFWKTIIPVDPVWNWHIEFLCDELQDVAERVFLNLPKEYDEIINISPGTTKSSLASILFPAWVWSVRPDMRFICASYTDKLALDLSRKCRDVIKSDLYRECFPNVQIKEDQDTKGYYALTKGGDRYSCGVGGSPMGFHGHFLIVDDPIDPQKAVSDAELLNANQWMAETLPTRKVNKEVTVTILIMQRLHQNDPTGNRLAKIDAGPIRHICLPAELLGRENEVKPKRLRKKYINKLMDPVRLSKKVLEENKAILGQYGYAGQFLQDPVPIGGGMFKTEKINMVPITSAPISGFKRIVRYWDNASGIGKKSDYSCGVKMGLDYSGKLWILDVKRGRWSSETREAMKIETARLDGPNVIIGQEQDPGSAGKESAEATVKRLIGYNVRLVKPTGNKEVRADPFSVQVNYGNVNMVMAGWNHEYIEEMRYFPNSTYDDQVDASSGACGLLTASIYYAGAM
jgi:predicted phage terminase large subunit-like protein